jgi:hypothetical protein
MLANYVELQRDVPTRLHFTDHYYVERLIADKELKREKTVRSLVMWVDRLNNEPCARTLSILSRKLASEIEPYLEGRRFRDFDFIITKRGEGFLTDYQVRVESHIP